jgi:hypothetical protein
VSPVHESPEQKLRSALSGYLMWVHNCREGNSCYPDCSELVSEATDQWMAAIDRWGVSGPTWPPATSRARATYFQAAPRRGSSSPRGPTGTPGASDSEQ